MRKILDGFDMFSRAMAVVTSLMAGGVILLIAGLFETMQGLRR